MHKYGESKTTRIMVATVGHVTSSSGLRKFQADGFLLDGVYLEQSLMNVVMGRIHALKMAMSQWSDQWQAQDRCPNSCSTPKKTHTVVHNLPQLHFCLLKQLSSISTTLPHSPRQPPFKQAVKNKSKQISTLPCRRTVSSQRHFGGQHRVPHNFGGLKDGTLLGRRASTVTESQPKWYEKSSNGWFCWEDNHLFCNRAYSINNIALDWQF